MSPCEKSKPTTKRNRRVSPTVPFVLSFSIDIMLRRMTASFSAHDQPVQPPTASVPPLSLSCPMRPPTKSILTACSIVISPSYADSLLFCANKKAASRRNPAKRPLVSASFIFRSNPAFFVSAQTFGSGRQAHTAVRTPSLSVPFAPFMFERQRHNRCVQTPKVRRFARKKPFIDFPRRQSFNQTESVRFRHGLKFFRRKTPKAQAPR